MFNNAAVTYSFRSMKLCLLQSYKVILLLQPCMCTVLQTTCTLATAIVIRKLQKSACLMTFALRFSYPSLIFILLCLAHDLKENNSHRDLLADITRSIFTTNH